ncbi:hypothetical protein HPB48_000542 [Haemaphysalis longicornis]|uniref:Uncharacterized protein n=1 Tax=Haemaphysalis longicornis TaxID=44386 RepID=A0A9J6GMD0_HAELO|nr:hypothetical protein HPB48_000542 [Haemaphysalis longicornis]
MDDQTFRVTQAPPSSLHRASTRQRPARCLSPRLVDEATQGTRGQDMSGDTTLASEGDEMCQTDDPTYDPSDFSLDADFPLGATFSRYTRFILLWLLTPHTTGGREPVLCGPLDNLGEPAKCAWQPRRKPPSGVGHLLRGLPPATVLRLLASINMQIFTERTFYNYQRAYLVPSVNEVFQEHESTLIDDLAGTEVELAGYGRCNSPGFSATYMTYSVLATEVDRIIRSEQIRVGESSAVATSVSMKKEALKTCLEKLDASGVMVQSLTTASRAFAALKGIVESPSLLSDLTKIAPAAQTFSLESLHSVLIHFAPKSNAFTQGVMKASFKKTGLSNALDAPENHFL